MLRARQIFAIGIKNSLRKTRLFSNSRHSGVEWFYLYFLFSKISNHWVFFLYNYSTRYTNKATVRWNIDEKRWIIRTRVMQRQRCRWMVSFGFRRRWQLPRCNSMYIIGKSESSILFYYWLTIMHIVFAFWESVTCCVKPQEKKNIETKIHTLNKQVARLMRIFANNSRCLKLLNVLIPTTYYFSFLKLKQKTIGSPSYSLSSWSIFRHWKANMWLERFSEKL